MTKSHAGPLLLVWPFHVDCWHYHQSHVLASVLRVQGHHGVWDKFRMAVSGVLG